MNHGSVFVLLSIFGKRVKCIRLSSNLLNALNWNDRLNSYLFKPIVLERPYLRNSYCSLVSSLTNFDYFGYKWVVFCSNYILLLYNKNIEDWRRLDHKFFWSWHFKLARLEAREPRSSASATQGQTNESLSSPAISLISTCYSFRLFPSRTLVCLRWLWQKVVAWFKYRKISEVEVGHQSPVFFINALFNYVHMLILVTKTLTFCKIVGIRPSTSEQLIYCLLVNRWALFLPATY